MVSETLIKPDQRTDFPYDLIFLIRDCSIGQRNVNHFLQKTRAPRIGKVHTTHGVSKITLQKRRWHLFVAA